MWSGVSFIMAYAALVISGVTAAEISGFIDIAGSRPGVAEGSSLFYWFFPAQSGVTDAPLLIWLQGGPGSPGELGLFFELGPYYLTEDLTLEPRTVGNWNKEFNLLFLDQPIGTGYSTAGSDSAYATSQDDVSTDLYVFLQRWLDENKQYASVPLFITGESYAGHYIPAFSAKILTENANIALTGNRFINLEGVAIGDGLTDPCSQVEAGPRAAFDFGLVSPKVFAKAKASAVSASLACAAGNWSAAHDYRAAMENTVLDAALINKYDVRTFDSYSYMDERMGQFMNQADTKKMLNVPQDVTFATDSQVSQKLYDDVMQSQADKFPLMLENIRVLLYQGQFDWKDGPFSNEKWLERISWSGQDEYLAAERECWLIKGAGGEQELSGWVQAYGSLTELVINGAGHLAPMNQPERLYSMITTFVLNETFEVVK